MTGNSPVTTGCGCTVTAPLREAGRLVRERDRVGDTFEAVVVDLDAEGATIQITEPADVALVESDGLSLGGEVRLEATDVYERVISFKVV